MKPHSEIISLKETLGNTSIDKIRIGLVDSRLRLLIWAECSGRNKFAALESRTKVLSATWRTWWTRGETPNGNLIEGAGKAWPHFAYWLTTGKTDVRCGHDMPELHPIAKGYVSNWPEEASKRVDVNNSYSREYLRACVEIDDQKSNAKQKIAYSSLKLISKEREKEIDVNFGAVVLDYEGILLEH